MQFVVMTIAVIVINCVKSVRIRSYSGLHFSRIFQNTERNGGSISPYAVRMRENAGNMRTKITPNTDTFYAVIIISFVSIITAITFLVTNTSYLFLLMLLYFHLNSCTLICFKCSLRFSVLSTLMRDHKK